MALVTCRKCGKQVSDLALECVHCGTVILKHEKIIGTGRSPFPMRCPRCGDDCYSNTCYTCGLPLVDYFYQEGDIEQRMGLAVDFTGEHRAKSTLYFRYAAELGNVHAINWLGVAYKDGFGVAKDEREAVGLFYIAAKRGDTHAQFNLAVCYEDGVGVKVDGEQAIYWYEKAAAQNNLDAIFNLGFNALFGNGPFAYRDLEMAFKYLTKAVALGDKQAMAYLGLMYSDGLYVAQSMPKALEYFQKSADANFPEGQHYLGLCYLTGRGIETNYSKGVTLLRLAAKQNWEPAINYLQYIGETF